MHSEYKTSILNCKTGILSRKKGILNNFSKIWSAPKMDCNAHKNECKE